MESDASCTISTSPEELAWRSQSTAFFFFFFFTGHSHHLAAFQLSGYKNIDIWDPDYMFIMWFSATKHNLQLSHSVYTVFLFVFFCFLRYHPPQPPPISDVLLHHSWGGGWGGGGGVKLHPLQHWTQNGNYDVVLTEESISIISLLIH